MKLVKDNRNNGPMKEDFMQTALLKILNVYPSTEKV